MIEEIGVKSKCLDISTLSLGMEDIKFCKITKIIQKFTIENKPYLRITIKDINGKSIVGRMFDDANGFLNSWRSWEKSIVLLHFSTTMYYDILSLNVISINLPDEKMQALLNEESFDSTNPHLEKAIIKLNSLNCTNNELIQFYNDVIKSSIFDDLMYYSDEDILDNTNGGIIVLLAMVYDDLLSYKEFELITSNELCAVMLALIIVQNAMIKDYNRSIMLKNVSIMSKCLSALTPLTGNVKSLVTNIVMSYCNLCLGITDNVSNLASMLNNVYNEKLKISKVLCIMHNHTIKSGDCLDIEGIKYYKD